MTNLPAVMGGGLTPDQVALIKRTIAFGASDDELALFITQCNRTGLDPFARQIYLIARKAKKGDQWVEVRQPLVAIDGFRLTAERTGKYGGQIGPFWCGEDGEWKDAWLHSKPPVAAKVGIVRTDWKQPCWGVARYDAYVQTTSGGGANSMWTKMPDNQLAKCAESLALRKAFPQELSGLYTTEEMEQAAVVEPPKVERQPEGDPKQTATEGKIAEPKAAPADAAHAAPIMCAIHDVEMSQEVSKKTGRLSKHFHRTADGSICTGEAQPATVGK